MAILHLQSRDDRPHSALISSRTLRCSLCHTSALLSLPSWWHGRRGETSAEGAVGGRHVAPLGRAIRPMLNRHGVALTTGCCRHPAALGQVSAPPPWPRGGSAQR